MLRYLQITVCDVRQTAVCNVVRFPQSQVSCNLTPILRFRPTGHYGPERPTVHNRYGTGFCSGWLVWKQTSPDWQRDKSRRRSGLVMQYHRVISDAVTKSSYQKQLLQWCQERHQRDALKSRTLSVRCDDSTLPRTMRCNALSASACEASQASPRSTSVAGSA